MRDMIRMTNCRSITVMMFLLTLSFILSCGGGGGDGSSSSSSSYSPAYLTPVSLSITPANPKIPLGLTQHLSITAPLPDGTAYQGNAAWTSSNQSVATICQGGCQNAAAQAIDAAPVAVGTTTITATIWSLSASTTLTVTSATLSSISIADNV